MTVTIFIPDIPEFDPLVTGARKVPGCTVNEPRGGYWQIDAADEILFERKPLGLGPALWNSALTGGFLGTIAEFSRDRLRIVTTGRSAA